MAFSNPVVGGETLIRPAIQSPNYQMGVAGWALSKDGSAEFDNMTLRNNLTVKNLSTETFTVGGNTIDQLLVKTARGAITYGLFDPSWSPIGPITTEQGIMELAFTAKAGRVYRIFGYLDGYFDGTNGAFAANSLGLRFHWTGDGTTPDLSSTAFNYRYKGFETSGYGEHQNYEYTVGWSKTADTDVRLLLSCSRAAGSNNFYATDGRIDVADVGDWTDYNNLAVRNNGSGGTTNPVQQYDQTWDATWAQSYQSNGSQSNATNANKYAYQGDGTQVGNPGGNTEGCFFFDWNTISSDLSGATILHTYVYVHNLHSYYNSGITAVIGTHNATATPGSVPSTSTNRWQISVAEGGGAWTGDLGTALGSELQSGTTKGLAMGYAPSSDLSYYGYFDTASIRVVYQK